MFELNDERAISRGRHDAPVIPPARNKYRLSEHQLETIRQERLEQKHSELRDAALAMIDAADGKIGEYHKLIRANYQSDYPLARYYAARSAQLKKHASQLAIELVLTGTDVSPWKTVAFLTGVIRGLLDTRVVQSEYTPQPYKAPRQTSAKTTKVAPPLQHHGPNTEIGAIIAEFNKRGNSSPELEKDAMRAIVEAKRAKRLAELGL